MGFRGVYRAIYDYAPQAQGELAIDEGDLLYILDDNDDDGWWKAKKKAGADDDDEPVGLVPNNYVQEAPSLGKARALFEYTRQTDEELSFHEDALLDVYDTSDPDWILVGLNKEYGFVPANYIELQAAEAVNAAPMAPSPPVLPARQPSTTTAPAPEPEVDTESEPLSPASVRSNPAAALAGVMQGRGAPQPLSPPPQPMRPSVEPEASDDEPIRSPTLPARPRVPPTSSRDQDDIEPASSDNYRAPGGFHMYNINEMVSVMGKRKKMPTTLGINLLTGVILIAPEKAQDGPSQEWTADKMTHYSREGKHVFMELVRPSKSIDFHAGAKDTAEEIVTALGELAGAVRAEGLREVIMAGTKQNQKRGQILYDFMAQGDDEVTVAAGDEVIVVDDTKSEEWWQVRRLKTGKEGVVPSSYIEITGNITPSAAPEPSTKLSAVEQNRMEEIRLTKEALKASKEPQQVGPGMPLPERGSSLRVNEHGNDSGQQRSRHESGRSDGGGQSKSAKSRPDASKVRNWTDRSRSFSVEAQFLGLKDGKIHLHKMNGVKIAVPIAKMSHDDLEYVERVTGISLDDEKPLADVKKSKQSEKKSMQSGATIEKPRQPEYDWFQFFLSCEVAVGLCERYAQAFAKESMDESVLPDVDATILRNLGLREGDIIKVMRTLDAKFSRNRGGQRNVGFASESGEGEGGLFSGPGGTLRNNTRKGRPVPAVQTNDVVDASAFSPRDSSGPTSKADHSASSPTPSPAAQKQNSTATGFDDNAWDVKPSKKQTEAQPAARETGSTGPVGQATSTPSPTPPPVLPTMTGSMKELSLLSEPLQPTRIEPQPTSGSAGRVPEQNVALPAASQPQLQGATPSFFSTVPQPQQSQGVMNNLASAQALMRQRPTPPQMTGQSSLVPPPPPQRPLSAPQSAQPSAFAPPMLSPQMTGVMQSQVAPPGQSLNEITQARLQQQYAAQMQQPAMTGFPGMQPQGLMAYPTGTPNQYMQPMMTGMPNQSPFGDSMRTGQFSALQPQMNGFQPSFANPHASFAQPSPTGPINNYLPPPLEPQRTGMPQVQPQPTGASGYGQNMPTPSLQPLVPQQTGPPPPVRFGVSNEKKLVPQPTGRRANLAQATPENPFGF
ncbi:hypothetical protein S7711_08217 [Stachybotrys chartarum IBT 7711]|uniref:Actin cytoskeleton-regulatory complex protein SLA1 n=1 Tax=Stachybotrys chartarum (strain CBS 109288 / IBT 7711) TaxID=1280523 RepID=A0A084AI48_STACB|nr:hypothetical protein S7711_08217 [Stachybotrys chartarum IBT 7711]